MASAADAIDSLTGPGGIFEVADEQVLGETVPVFKNRFRSLREMLAASGAKADVEYLVSGDRRVSYEEHVRLVASTAQVFRDQYGVGPGDRVAILAANRFEWVISFWATVSLGGVVASLNGWWTRDEILYGLSDSAPRLLVGDRRRLERVADDNLDCRTVVIEDQFAEILAAHPGADLPASQIAEDDPAVILYTSGTTGRPKGAVASHRGIVGFAQASMCQGALRAMEAGAGAGARSRESRVLVTSPLFHLSGLYAITVLRLVTGATLVFGPPRFDPEAVLQLIEFERITDWSALGSTGPRVLDHPRFGDYDTSTLASIGFGGAPTSPALQQRVREGFPNAAHAVGLGYGSSETVSVVASIGGAELRAHPTSTGRILPTVAVEIRDPAGNSLPEGAEGEIHCRSAYTMLEYWMNPGATAEVYKQPGRWLATGDIGRLEGGRLFINSRARDMILRSAENIHPAEIEHRLDEHPAVAESAVVGVDHPEHGQEVKAVVVAAAGEDADPADLRDWCSETLALFKVPTVWAIRDEPLPRNAAGKVLKTELG